MKRYIIRYRINKRDLKTHKVEHGELKYSDISEVISECIRLNDAENATPRYLYFWEAKEILDAN